MDDFVNLVKEEVDRMLDLYLKVVSKDAVSNNRWQKRLLQIREVFLILK